MVYNDVGECEALNCFQHKAYINNSLIYGIKLFSNKLRYILNFE